MKKLCIAIMVFIILINVNIVFADNIVKIDTKNPNKLVPLEEATKEVMDIYQAIYCVQQLNVNITFIDYLDDLETKGMHFEYRIEKRLAGGDMEGNNWAADVLILECSDFLQLELFSKNYIIKEKGNFSYNELTFVIPQDNENELTIPEGIIDRAFLVVIGPFEINELMDEYGMKHMVYVAIDMEKSYDVNNLVYYIEKE